MGSVVAVINFSSWPQTQHLANDIRCYRSGKNPRTLFLRPEQGMGRSVMGQMGHENGMGHMGHGSLGDDPWPISFLTLAGLIYCGHDNIEVSSAVRHC